MLRTTPPSAPPLRWSLERDHSPRRRPPRRLPLGSRTAWGASWAESPRRSAAWLPPYVETRERADKVHWIPRLPGSVI